MPIAVFIQLVKKSAAGGVYLKGQLHGRPPRQKTTATDDTPVFVTSTFADFKLACLPFEQLPSLRSRTELKCLNSTNARIVLHRTCHSWKNWGSACANCASR